MVVVVVRVRALIRRLALLQLRMKPRELQFHVTKREGLAPPRKTAHFCEAWKDGGLESSQVDSCAASGAI
jgi:hypothetical protein